MKANWIVILVATLALVAACQPVEAPEEGSSVSLVETIWLLVDMGGEAIPAEVGVTAIFASDGSLSGSAGCNYYSTPYTVDGYAMAVDPAMVGMI